MASDVENEHRGGDSARSPRSTQRSQHVVDEAGENLYCRPSSPQGSESRKRYINPAIYTETAESSRSVSLNGEDMTPHPHTTYRSVSTPYLSGSDTGCSVSRKSCLLLDTTRKSEDEGERNDRTYREDGQDTFRLSVASLETSTTTKEERERIEMKRQQAFREWCARKEQEKRERKRQEREKQQPIPQPTTTSAQREESFRRWVERKRNEAVRSKADVMMHTFRSEMELDELRSRKDREKQEKLNEWIRKKEEDTKEMRSRLERAASEAAAAEERRRNAGEKAYRNWLRVSKHKPLPVPLNMGELSMRGSVSDMYINPVPWQPPT